MRTYILSRNLETMFRVYPAGDKMRYLGETSVIVGIRMNTEPDRYLPWDTIPEVAMWEDYEPALLLYYEAQIEDALHYGMTMGNLALIATARMHKVQLDACKKMLWGDTIESAQGGMTGLNMTNPILTATDELIVSHCVDLVRADPIYYTQQYPHLHDLSVPYSTDWEYSGQDF